MSDPQATVSSNSGAFRSTHGEPLGPGPVSACPGMGSTDQHVRFGVTFDLDGILSSDRTGRRAGLNTPHRMNRDAGEYEIVIEARSLLTPGRNNSIFRNQR